jgi:hypothetical protein
LETLFLKIVEKQSHSVLLSLQTRFSNSNLKTLVSDQIVNNFENAMILDSESENQSLPHLKIKYYNDLAITVRVHPQKGTIFLEDDDILNTDNTKSDSNVLLQVQNMMNSEVDIEKPLMFLRFSKIFELVKTAASFYHVDLIHDTAKFINSSG